MASGIPPLHGPDNAIWRAVVNVAHVVWIFVDPDEVDLLATHYREIDTLFQQGADELERQADVVESEAWLDSYGTMFANRLRGSAEDLRALGHEAMARSDLATRYAKHIRAYRREILSELAFLVGLSVLLGGIPLVAGRLAGGIARNFAMKAHSLMKTFASGLQFEGMRAGMRLSGKQLAQKLGVEFFSESGQEFTVDALKQWFANLAGDQKGYNAKQGAKATVSGAGAVAPASAANKVVDSVAKQLSPRRRADPEAKPGQIGQAIQGGVGSAAGSPVGGMLGEAVVEGDLGILFDGEKWGQAVSPQNLVQAGLIGAGYPPTLNGANYVGDAGWKAGGGDPPNNNNVGAGPTTAEASATAMGTAEANGAGTETGGAPGAAEARSEGARAGSTGTPGAGQQAESNGTTTPHEDAGSANNGTTDRLNPTESTPDNGSGQSTSRPPGTGNPGNGPGTDAPVRSGTATANAQPQQQDQHYSEAPPEESSLDENDDVSGVPIKSGEQTSQEAGFPTESSSVSTPTETHDDGAPPSPTDPTHPTNVADPTATRDSAENAGAGNSVAPGTTATTPPSGDGPAAVPTADESAETLGLAGGSATDTTNLGVGGGVLPVQPAAGQPTATPPVPSGSSAASATTPKRSDDLADNDTSDNVTGDKVTGDEASSPAAAAASADAAAEASNASEAEAETGANSGRPSSERVLGREQNRTDKRPKHGRRGRERRDVQPRPGPTGPAGSAAPPNMEPGRSTTERGRGQDPTAGVASGTADPQGPVPVGPGASAAIPAQTAVPITDGSATDAADAAPPEGSPRHTAVGAPVARHPEHGDDAQKPEISNGSGPVPLDPSPRPDAGSDAGSGGPPTNPPTPPPTDQGPPAPGPDPNDDGDDNQDGEHNENDQDSQPVEVTLRLEGSPRDIAELVDLPETLASHRQQINESLRRWWRDAAEGFVVDVLIQVRGPSATLHVQAEATRGNEHRSGTDVFSAHGRHLVRVRTDYGADGRRTNVRVTLHHGAESQALSELIALPQLREGHSYDQEQVTEFLHPWLGRLGQGFDVIVTAHREPNPSGDIVEVGVSAIPVEDGEIARDSRTFRGEVDPEHAPAGYEIVLEPGATPHAVDELAHLPAAFREQIADFLRPLWRLAGDGQRVQVFVQAPDQSGRVYAHFSAGVGNARTTGAEIIEILSGRVAPPDAEQNYDELSRPGDDLSYRLTVEPGTEFRAQDILHRIFHVLGARSDLASLAQFVERSRVLERIREIVGSGTMAELTIRPLRGGEGRVLELYVQAEQDGPKPTAAADASLGRAGGAWRREEMHTDRVDQQVSVYAIPGGADVAIDSIVPTLPVPWQSLSDEAIALLYSVRQRVGEGFEGQVRWTLDVSRNVLTLTFQGYRGNEYLQGSAFSALPGSEQGPATPEADESGEAAPVDDPTPLDGAATTDDSGPPDREETTDNTADSLIADLWNEFDAPGTRQARGNEVTRLPGPDGTVHVVTATLTESLPSPPVEELAAEQAAAAELGLPVQEDLRALGSDLIPGGVASLLPLGVDVEPDAVEGFLNVVRTLVGEGETVYIEFQRHYRPGTEGLGEAGLRVFIEHTDHPGSGDVMVLAAAGIPVDGTPTTDAHFGVPSAWSDWFASKETRPSEASTYAAVQPELATAGPNAATGRNRLRAGLSAVSRPLLNRVDRLVGEFDEEPADAPTNQHDGLVEAFGRALTDDGLAQRGGIEVSTGPASRPQDDGQWVNVAEYVVKPNGARSFRMYVHTGNDQVTEPLVRIDPGRRTAEVTLPPGTDPKLVPQLAAMLIGGLSNNEWAEGPNAADAQLGLLHQVIAENRGDTTALRSLLDWLDLANNTALLLELDPNDLPAKERQVVKQYLEQAWSADAPNTKDRTTRFILLGVHEGQGANIVYGLFGVTDLSGTEAEALPSLMIPKALDGALDSDPAPQAAGVVTVTDVGQGRVPAQDYRGRRRYLRLFRIVPSEGEPFTLKVGLHEGRESVPLEPGQALLVFGESAPGEPGQPQRQAELWVSPEMPSERVETMVAQVLAALSGDWTSGPNVEKARLAELRLLAWREDTAGRLELLTRLRQLDLVALDRLSDLLTDSDGTLLELIRDEVGARSEDTGDGPGPVTFFRVPPLDTSTADGAAEENAGPNDGPDDSDPDDGLGSSGPVPDEPTDLPGPGGGAPRPDADPDADPDAEHNESENTPTDAENATGTSSSENPGSPGTEAQADTRSEGRPTRRGTGSSLRHVLHRDRGGQRATQAGGPRYSARCLVPARTAGRVPVPARPVAEPVLTTPAARVMVGDRPHSGTSGNAGTPEATEPTRVSVEQNSEPPPADPGSSGPPGPPIDRNPPPTDPGSTDPGPDPDDDGNDGEPSGEKGNPSSGTKAKQENSQEDTREAQADRRRRFEAPGVHRWHENTVHREEGPGGRVDKVTALIRRLYDELDGGVRERVQNLQQALGVRPGPGGPFMGWKLHPLGGIHNLLPSGIAVDERQLLGLAWSLEGLAKEHTLVVRAVRVSGARGDEVRVTATDGRGTVLLEATLEATANPTDSNETYLAAHEFSSSPDNMVHEQYTPAGRLNRLSMRLRDFFAQTPAEARMRAHGEEPDGGWPRGWPGGVKLFPGALETLAARFGLSVTDWSAYDDTVEPELLRAMELGHEVRLDWRRARDGLQLSYQVRNRSTGEIELARHITFPATVLDVDPVTGPTAGTPSQRQPQPEPDESGVADTPLEGIGVSFDSFASPPNDVVPQIGPMRAGRTLFTGDVLDSQDVQHARDAQSVLDVLAVALQYEWWFVDRVDVVAIRDGVVEAIVYPQDSTRLPFRVLAAVGDVPGDVPAKIGMDRARRTMHLTISDRLSVMDNGIRVTSAVAFALGVGEHFGWTEPLRPDALGVSRDPYEVLRLSSRDHGFLAMMRYIAELLGADMVEGRERTVAELLLKATLSELGALQDQLLANRIIDQMPSEDRPVVRKLIDGMQAGNLGRSTGVYVATRLLPAGLMLIPAVIGGLAVGGLLPALANMIPYLVHVWVQARGEQRREGSQVEPGRPSDDIGPAPRGGLARLLPGMPAPEKLDSSQQSESLWEKYKKWFRPSFWGATATGLLLPTGFISPYLLVLYGGMALVYPLVDYWVTKQLAKDQAERKADILAQEMYRDDRFENVLIDHLLRLFKRFQAATGRLNEFEQMRVENPRHDGPGRARRGATAVPDWGPWIRGLMSGIEQGIINGTAQFGIVIGELTVRGELQGIDTKLQTFDVREMLRQSDSALAREALGILDHLNALVADAEKLAGGLPAATESTEPANNRLPEVPPPPAREDRPKPGVSKRWFLAYAVVPLTAAGLGILLFATGWLSLPGIVSLLSITGTLALTLPALKWTEKRSELTKLDDTRVAVGGQVLDRARLTENLAVFGHLVRLMRRAWDQHHRELTPADSGAPAQRGHAAAATGRLEARHLFAGGVSTNQVRAAIREAQVANATAAIGEPDQLQAERGRRHRMLREIERRADELDTFASTVDLRDPRNVRALHRVRRELAHAYNQYASLEDLGGRSTGLPPLDAVDPERGRMAIGRAGRLLLEVEQARERLAQAQLQHPHLFDPMAVLTQLVRLQQVERAIDVERRAHDVAAESGDPTLLHRVSGELNELIAKYDAKIAELGIPGGLGYQTALPDRPIVIGLPGSSPSHTEQTVAAIRERAPDSSDGDQNDGNAIEGEVENDEDDGPGDGPGPDDPTPPDPDDPEPDGGPSGGPGPTTPDPTPSEPDGSGAAKPAAAEQEQESNTSSTDRAPGGPDSDPTNAPSSSELPRQRTSIVDIINPNVGAVGGRTDSEPADAPASPAPDVQPTPRDDRGLTDDGTETAGAIDPENSDDTPEGATNDRPGRKGFGARLLRTSGALLTFGGVVAAILAVGGTQSESADSHALDAAEASIELVSNQTGMPATPDLPALPTVAEHLLAEDDQHGDQQGDQYSDQQSDQQDGPAYSGQDGLPARESGKHRHERRGPGPGRRRRRRRRQRLAEAERGWDGSPSESTRHRTTWEPGETDSASTGTSAELAGPVEVAPSVPETSDPGTLAAVRDQVAARISQLQESVDVLTKLAAAKQRSSEAASEERTGKQEVASAESELADSGAAVRKHRAESAALSAEAKQHRHAEIAEAYQRAAQRATEARDAGQRLADGIAAVEAGQRHDTDAVRELADEADARVHDFLRSLDEIRPPRRVLPGAAPDGPPPHLAALTARVNQVLADNGIRHSYDEKTLRWILWSEFRQVTSDDGLVLTIDGHARDDVTDVAQIWIQLRAGELSELLRTDPNAAEASEIIDGKIDHSGHDGSAHGTQSQARTYGLGSKLIASMTPDGHWWKAASEAVPLGIERGGSDSREEHSGSSRDARNSTVLDNRAESVPYEASAVWEIRVRNSALGPWSAPEAVDGGRSEDAENLRTWISHAYTGPGPETTTIEAEGLGEARSELLPEHKTLYVNGLEGMADDVVSKTVDLLGKLDRIAHDHIRHLFTRRLPSQLLEASRPGGIGQVIVVDGRPVAYVQVRARVDVGSARMVGRWSSENWMERLRVGFTGVSGSQTFNKSGSWSLKGSVGMSDLGSSAVDLKPEASGGRGARRNDGTSVARSAIDVGLRRCPTTAAGVRISYEATVYRLGTGESRTSERAGDAMLRLAENDAFWYGLPVDVNAVERNDDRTPKTGDDGRTLLRADPQPTSQALELPSWFGDGPGQLAGPVQVRLTDAESAREKFIRALSERGVLPPLNDDLSPNMAELPLDRLLATSQLNNLQRVQQLFPTVAAETWYADVAKHGITVQLPVHRTGHAPQTRTFRLRLRQDFGRATYLGLSQYATVRLPIGSDSTTRSRGRSKQWPWSASLRAGDSPEVGQQVGFTARGGRSSFGRSLGWSTGSTVNRVSLIEPNAEVAEFLVQSTLEISETDATGGARQVIEDVGCTARLQIDSELCRQPPGAQVRPDGSLPPGVASPGTTDPALLDSGRVMTVDVDALVALIDRQLPAGVRLDPESEQKLAHFLHSTNLATHSGEWLNSGYRTHLTVNPSPSVTDPTDLVTNPLGRHQSVRVCVTGEVHNERVVAVSSQVTGDIGLIFQQAGASEGGFTQSDVGAGTVDGMAGPVESTEFPVGVGRTGNPSWTGTTSSTNGSESLIVRGVEGLHYVLLADATFEVQIDNTDPKQVSGTMLFAVPEQDALRLYGQGRRDLPFGLVADAIERLRTGKLKLDRRSMVAVLSRYQAARSSSVQADVIEGPAARHTAEERLALFEKVSGRELPVSESETAEQVLEAALAEGPTEPAEVDLPDHYTRMPAMAMVERAVDPTDSDQSLDLLGTVRDAIAEVSPDVLSVDPVLAESLSTDLAGEAWREQLENMLDPKGFERSYTVRESGTMAGEELTVRITARFDGPVTIDGNPGDPTKEDAIQIRQRYLQLLQSRELGQSTSYAVSADGTVSSGSDLNLGAATDRSRQRSATSGEQLTRLQRLAYHDLTRVTRDLKLTVVVERRRRPGATRVQGRREIPLAIRTTQLVPRAFVTPARPGSGPSGSLTGVLRPAPGKHVELPDAYLVEGTLPYPSDETGDPEDLIFLRTYQRLQALDMLTRTGARVHRTEMVNQLSAAQRNAAFPMMAVGRYGYRMVRLPGPRLLAGYRGQWVNVNVGASVTGVELLAGPVNGELGNVDRRQEESQTGMSGNRTRPISGSYGGDSGGTGFSTKVTFGEHGWSNDSVTFRARKETSEFRKGKLVTVGVHVNYHLWFFRGSRSALESGMLQPYDRLHNAATGYTVLTMLEQDYHAMVRGLEPSPGVQDRADVLGVDSGQNGENRGDDPGPTEPPPDPDDPEPDGGASGGPSPTTPGPTPSKPDGSGAAKPASAEQEQEQESITSSSDRESDGHDVAPRNTTPDGSQARRGTSIADIINPASADPDHGPPDNQPERTAPGPDDRRADASAWDNVEGEKPDRVKIHVNEARRVHVLYGDGLGGGGHAAGSCEPGKTTFPEAWPDDKIVQEVEDVAKNPSHPPELQDNDRWLAKGTRDGVEIEVVILPDGLIWTAYPKGGPGVIKNDQYGNPRV